jgi:hypothetical protein
MFKGVFLAAASVVLVAGCATSEVDYSPPLVSQVDNEAEIPGDFDAVWDRLIKNLASDFFLINNVEKASRIINVSFSSNEPEKYVDCGVSHRSFTDARGKTDYFYPTAKSSVFVFVDTQTGQAFNARRQTKLEGRANIYVATTSENTTTVSVNTKYVFNINLTFTDINGVPAGGTSNSFELSTKTPFIPNTDNPTAEIISCASAGVLEKKILSYAR